MLPTKLLNRNYHENCWLTCLAKHGTYLRFVPTGQQLLPLPSVIPCPRLTCDLSQWDHTPGPTLSLRNTVPFQCILTTFIKESRCRWNGSSLFRTSSEQKLIQWRSISSKTNVSPRSRNVCLVFLQAESTRNKKKCSLSLYFSTRRATNVLIGSIESYGIGV